MNKLIRTGLLLALPALLLLQGCDKCEGEDPALTEAEKNWIPYASSGDSVVFRNRDGKQQTFYESRFFSTVNKSNNVKVNACPEDKVATGVYALATTRVPDPLPMHLRMRVVVQKTTTQFTKQFYWLELHGNQHFADFNQHLDSLIVNGTTYRDIHVFENDTTYASDYSGPLTYRLYYTREFGLIRYDNTGKQVWERVK